MTTKNNSIIALLMLGACSPNHVEQPSVDPSLTEGGYLANEIRVHRRFQRGPLT